MGKDLTKGNVLKTIVWFSLPYLLAYFLQTLYGMADLYVIGQFCGVESTTAVSVGSQVMHMFTVMIVGLSMGGIVRIGQAIGAKDQEKAAASIGNAVTMFMILSLVATVALLIFVNPIVRVVSTPKEAVEGTTIYLVICFVGIPFITAYNVICSIFRGMGDSKSPMYFIAIACVLNIGLDYFFIGLFNFGPAGAALGTVLAQMFSVFAALLSIRKRKFGITVQRKHFKPDKQAMKSMLKIGAPVALQDGFIQVSFIIVTIFANLRGLNDAAAVGIVEKLIGILFLVPSSMLQSVSVISAQNIGAEKHDRARKTLSYGCRITVVWGLFAVLIMALYSPWIIGMFSENSEVVRLGCEYMRSYVWDCVFAGIHFCFSGYFCAYGLSEFSFIHNAISIVLVRIPFSYYASTRFRTTLFPMGMASTLGSMLSVIICLILYKFKRPGRKEIKKF